MTIGVNRAKWFFILPYVLLYFFSYCKTKPYEMETRKTIKGILTDQEGAPVADAVVVIVSGSSDFNEIASVSNDGGEFYISNVVVPGNYTLQINSKDQAIQKDISLAEQDSTISVSLQ
jgi:hypothetical protein